MPSIFISYSRVDIKFIETLYNRLRQMRPRDHIWYDQAPDGLLGGDSWWDEILDNIAKSDIFIYVLSNESVTSKYCQAEFEEARRLQKRIITIQARDRTKLTDALSDIQYVDMKNGVDDVNAITKLSGALDRQAAQIRRRRALWKPRTPRPSDEDAPTRDESAPEIDTPTLLAPRPDIATQPTPQIPYVWMIVIVVVLIIIGLGGLALNTFAPQETITPTIATEVAEEPTDTPENNNQAAPTDAPTATDEPTHTEEPDNTPTDNPTNTDSPTLTDTPSRTPTPTQTLSPTPTNTPDIEAAAQTLIAEQLAEQETLIAGQTATEETFKTREAAQKIIDNATATAALKTLVVQQTQTQSAAETATATLWTDTPTPNFTASVEALLTEWAEGTQTQESNNLTATATLWTATPTATFTPSNTPTATDTPTPTFTPSNTPTSTPTPTNTSIPPEEIAKTPVAQNADWTPVERDFDGVTMVLVPVGCFMMGSDNGDEDEQPVHEQCFDEPFWIDKYEVMQSDFERLNGVKETENAFDGDNRPVETITWFEARDFCMKRDVRLPTEREWEYAARGPDNLIYPWGHDFVSDNVTFNDNSNAQTSTVLSHPLGASWIGVVNMSGNVWEWVNSTYVEYPYVEGRVFFGDNILYVMRGGSFLNSDRDIRSANRGARNTDSGSNFVGFRCARDLNLADGQSQFSTIPIEAPSLTPSPSLAPTEVECTATVNSFTNLRQSSSTSSPVVDVLSQGETMIVTGRNVDVTWLYGRLNSNEAWIYAGLVNLTCNANSLPIVQ